MAGTYSLYIDAGADFSIRFNVKNSDGTIVDLTGYSARMQVRRLHTSATVDLSLTSPVGGLSVGGSDGNVDIDITNAQTAALCVNNAESVYFYDLEVQSEGGQVTRVVEGKVIVKPQITR
jgi:uncharacterized protein YegP (UPF0339 family)